MTVKRIFAMLAALSLLLSLAGCGGEGETTMESSGGPEDSLDLTDVRSAQLDEELTLTAEWPSYASLDATVYVVLENNSKETVTSGSEFSLERDMGGGGEFSWYQLELKENAGWTAIEYVIPPGESMAFACNLSVYDTAFLTDGHFRIVKWAGGKMCVAEFTVSDDATVSEDAPYGFGPLENLPGGYSAAAASENDVVYTGSGGENEAAVGTFLRKVGLDIPCQLRVVQDYGEGTPMVLDVVYENSHFLWRMLQGGYITERRYAYVVTDGQDLYLSNGADWENTENYHSKKTLLVPEGMALPSAIVQVRELTETRLEGNGARYRVWSADGEWDAMLTETSTEFGVGWQKPGEGSSGQMYDLNQWDGLETAITDLQWQENGTLLLVCETVNGGISRLTFDPETGYLTSGA